jgi:serralysin
VVRVYNGKSAALMNSFAPFVAGSVSGIYVAAGDMNGDGKAEVVVSNGSMGTGANSNTRVYDGAYISSGKVVVSASIGGTQIAQGRLRDFYAFTNATGSSAGNGTTFTANTGATVAMGDFNGDGRADLVVGVTSGGPGVRGVRRVR